MRSRYSSSGSASEEKKSSKTQSEYLTEIANLKEKLRAKEVRAPELFLTDVTPEAAQTGLAEQDERLAVLTDEGNFFDIVSGMYSNGKQNLDVFLQGHAGGALRVKRGQRSVHLNKIAVSIGLVIQPAILTEQSEADRRKFRGKGLLARFLFNIQKSNIGERDVNLNQPIPAEVKAAYCERMKALLNIQPKLDQHKTEIPRLVTLQEGALTVWKNFAQYIESHQGAGGMFEQLQDFTAKLPGAALRIAGVCSVAEQVGCKETTSPASSSLSQKDPAENIQITQDVIEPILHLCKDLIIHTQAAFDLMGDDPVISDAKYALKWILANVEPDISGAFFIRQNALHTTPRFKNSKVERLTKALDVLRERNLTSGQFTLKTKKPTYIYYVNPSILPDWRLARSGT